MFRKHKGDYRASKYPNQHYWLQGSQGHRTSRYLNNRIEQDHNGIQQRNYPSSGFGSLASAARFCTHSVSFASIFA